MVLSFPTLSFFIVYKSEPCICTPRDRHYTHYRGQLESPSPIWSEDQDHLCLLGTSCPGQVTGKLQAPNIKLFCSPAFRTWSPTTEEEKYPSLLTLSGGLSKRKMLSLCKFWASMNVWSQEKPEGALSPPARSCQGQTLNCPSAPPHMEAPASATGRMLHLLSSCASLFPKLARARSGGEGKLFCYYTPIQGMKSQQKIMDKWPLYVATALCLAL